LAFGEMIASAYPDNVLPGGVPVGAPVHIAALAIDFDVDIADADAWHPFGPPLDTTITELRCDVSSGTSIQIDVYLGKGTGGTQVGSTLTCDGDGDLQTGLSVNMSANQRITFDVVDGSNTGSVQKLDISVTGVRR
jgi:hypothetical protein